MKVLILGATGLVGRNALAHALTQPALTKQDKLINPDFVYLVRADMGIWHLLGEIGATVNVSEVSRRVAAAATGARV